MSAHALDQLRHALDAIALQVNHAQTAANQLQAQGLTYAGTWMKDGKYLYLVFPADDSGQRRREYIGADPEAQAAALAGIERAAQYDRLQAEIRRLAERKRTAGTYINYALAALGPLVTAIPGAGGDRRSSCHQAW